MGMKRKMEDIRSETDEIAEGNVEALTAGLVLLIFALFLLTDISNSMAMTAAGIVLLGSGFYQSRKGWHVSFTTWLIGGVLLLGGIGLRFVLISYLNINWVPLTLILIGGYIVWENFMRRR